MKGLRIQFQSYPSMYFPSIALSSNLLQIYIQSPGIQKPYEADDVKVCKLYSVLSSQEVLWFSDLLHLYIATDHDLPTPI